MKIALFMLLVIGTNAFGQSTPRIAKSPIEFVPGGYVVSESIHGDLNKDNQADYYSNNQGNEEGKFC